MMIETYTTGTWTPNPGATDAFVEAWTDFAAWASGMPGAGTLRLVCDVRDTSRYMSFGDWSSADAIRQWKTSPEFRERLAHVLQHVSDFRPSELALVATADGGTATAAHTTA
jgi:heme-degrading monooxygenase HmoA